MWKKAKVYGISPLQIQILIFVSTHPLALSNVSDLAKEFNLTRPTISDAIKSLISKEYLDKDYSELDSRRFNLLLTVRGIELLKEIKDYSNPIAKKLLDLDENELGVVFKILTSIIFELNKSGVIEVQRTCYGCKFYSGDRANKHHCKLLEKDLHTTDIRLDCREFETAQI